MKKQAEGLRHSPVAMGGALVGLSLPKQCLFKVQNVKLHCTNVKLPYRRLSGDGSVATPSISIISHLFGNNGWILTPSMSSHS